MKMRVYDERGRERWVSAGQIVPAGWYVQKEKEMVCLQAEHIVSIKKEPGNPFDQHARNNFYLELKEIS